MPEHVCKKAHSEVVGHTATEIALAGLPPSQRGAMRHVCAACAYERGYEMGFERALMLLQSELDRIRQQRRDQR
jgi:hypothetical protein